MSSCLGEGVILPGEGVLKFGFGSDVPPQNLKVDPYKTIFQEKVTHSFTNLLNFGRNVD